MLFNAVSIHSPKHDYVEFGCMQQNKEYYVR